jgi:hypothetical protein
MMQYADQLPWSAYFFWQHGVKMVIKFKNLLHNHNGMVLF